MPQGWSSDERVKRTIVWSDALDRTVAERAEQSGTTPSDLVAQIVESALGGAAEPAAQDQPAFRQA